MECTQLFPELSFFRGIKSLQACKCMECSIHWMASNYPSAPSEVCVSLENAVNGTISHQRYQWYTDRRHGEP